MMHHDGHYYFSNVITCDDAQTYECALACTCEYSYPLMHACMIEFEKRFKLCMNSCIC